MQNVFASKTIIGLRHLIKYIDPNVFHIRICDKDNVKEDMEVKPVEDGCETEVDIDRNSKINI